MQIKIKPPDNIPITFSSVGVPETNTDTKTCMILDQTDYINRKVDVGMKSSYEEFLSIRHKIVRATSTRPDVISAISIFNQVIKSILA